MSGALPRERQGDRAGGWEASMLLMPNDDE